MLRKHGAVLKKHQNRTADLLCPPPALAAQARARPIRTYM